MIKDKNVYFNLLSYVPKHLKKRVIILIPLLSLSGILEVASLALLIPLISLVLQPSSNAVVGVVELLGFVNYSDSQKIVFIFSIFMVVIILKGVFVFFVSKFTFNTALLIKTEFQKKLFIGYLKKNFIQHLSSNSAHYIRNITTECHQIEGRFIMPGLTMIAEILPVLFIVGFLIYLNSQGVFIAFFIFLIAGLLITKLTSKYLKKYGQEQIHSDGMQIKIAKESFSTLKEINLYEKENKISAIYNNYVSASANLIGKALALGQIPKLVLEIVGLLTISLIAYISFSKGATANDVLVELAVFMGAIVKLIPSANRIVMNLQSLTHAKPAIENILKEMESIPDISKVIHNANQQIKKILTIDFKSVSFKYPSRDEYVLKNINLHISQGDIIGIKGESGSGKSTIINLILGLLETTEGEILINDINIKDCRKSWQNKISYVPQEVVLFDDSLKNNILFFDEEISIDNVTKALEGLKLNELVFHMKEGLETIIGEGGSSLSGGQKQRIGIARALVRNPEFIVFDEATSALDSITEQEINKLIKEISQHCIVLIIAHKQSAFNICDNVYTIKNKTLIEEEN